MVNKARKFLWGSFVGVISVCIIVFCWLAIFMSVKTEESIYEVSEIYMKEMNTQLQQKFASIISLRHEQVEGIIRGMPTDTAQYGEKMLQELTQNAKYRNFSYMGFYTEDGRLEKICGSNVEIAGSDDVIGSLEANGSIVEQGIDENGQKVLLLGKEAAYPMADGKRSRALIVGVGMEYLNSALFLDENEEGQVYSHVVDKDGNFVIRNADAYRSSYFERVREVYKTIDGKSPDDFCQELQTAMEEGKSYSALVLIEGEERQIYCSPISENSTWYLITVMSNNMLKGAITKLDKVRTLIMMGSSMIILVMMSMVFFFYFRLVGQQMRELKKAKEEAARKAAQEAAKQTPQIGEGERIAEDGSVEQIPQ